jgi:cell division cycle 20-like protein 1, cofactor of APC complex
MHTFATTLTLEIPCLACTRSQRRPCPSSQVATLTGHTLRVLYLAMSPDGQTIVTGAGDETLRFWNVFPGPKTKGDASDSSSMLDFQGRTSIR